MVSLIFFTFQIRRVPAAMGFWTRHLPVFVVILLLSETIADKEFWWMGQEGTFGQGSQVGLLPLFPNELLRAKEPKGRLHRRQITSKRDKQNKVDKVGILSLICSTAWVSTQLGDWISWT